MNTVAEHTSSHYVEFTRRLQKALDENGDNVAVVMLEACNMPRIDARFGRKHRNELIGKLAERIDGAIRDADFAAQIGEHTFAIIFPGLKNRGHATLAGKKLLRLSDPEHEERNRYIGVIESRVGIALCPEHADAVDTLVQRAQLALEIAKDTNRDLVIYDEDSVGKAAVTWELRDDLAEAIRESELDVFYQPKIDLQDDCVQGAEALARWFSGKRGTVPPDEFVPVAESCELIQPLTQYMLNTALRSLMMWQRDGHDIGMAINVPAEMLLDQGIVGMVQSLISVWDVEPQRLTLELTESAIMEDVDAAFLTMSKLKDLGCRMSIDDFGTGYSSFSYFKKIPADELKIDRTFIDGMVDDSADQHIVETIISLAHRFNMKVVAEGIETEETLALLRKLGCDTGQGYLISKPMNQADFDAWLDVRRYAQPEH